jgi:hypothetical protein
VGVWALAAEGVRNCDKECSLLGVTLDGSDLALDAGEPTPSRIFELGVLILPTLDRLGVEGSGKILSK